MYVVPTYISLSAFLGVSAITFDPQNLPNEWIHSDIVSTLLIPNEN